MATPRRLFTAKVRPPSCSPVRWRIELRRRAAAAALGVKFLSDGECHRTGDGCRTGILRGIATYNF